MAAPVPVATLGCDAKISEAVRERLLPDFDVVHTCLDATEAEAELPALFAGELETANASGLGSNVSRPVDERAVPKMALFGCYVADNVVERIMAAIHARVPGIRAVKVSKLDVCRAGGFGPNPDVIAKVCRMKIAAEK